MTDESKCGAVRRVGWSELLYGIFNGGTMYLQKFHGWQLCFSNGFSVGFAWVHCNGETSKRSAMLASFHPRDR